jgi:DNA-directed RNA polymerase subunit A"
MASHDSVLMKASFEIPFRHFISASLIGQKNELNSVIDNVMVNQIVPIGTGMVKLIYDPKKQNKE